MIVNFEEWSLNEYNMGKLNFEKSPFKNVPELTYKVGSQKGELNMAGRFVHYVYANPGLTKKEIFRILLNCPTCREDQFGARGGLSLGAHMKKALESGHIVRDTGRPMKLYARVDKTESLEDVIKRNSGRITGKKYGL